ncbi:VOC family protein [Octadecabacter ascidiaceicola]|uniref:Glyoxalase-like domain protein n=1 Tax=Octadecabacter ascidiaceicola TaxID=1655543 RepID=A0A238KHU5_9RHOB|nr:VOC family protein [Octadecabacter ascidiaceicola]SMX42164.1 Glyoxalase-like domain protein [Octadecabacter ascidiaceicola]
MKLGAFSISLAVKDLPASMAFYQDLGFTHFGGLVEHNFAIMKNGDTLVGLFQGMFEKNMLTFNPGWDQSAGEVNPFDDVRDIKAKVKAAGHEVSQDLGEEIGVGSFVVIDPDGNPILIDQHR